MQFRYLDAFHVIGWVAYVPLVGMALVFYAVVVGVLGFLLRILSYVDVDGVELILGSIYTTSSMVAWLLSRLGMRVGFDPASIPSAVLGKLFCNEGGIVCNLTIEYC